MNLLLDTNVLSDFVRGHPDVQARLRATPPVALAVASVTVMEIAYGLERQPERARRLRPPLEALLGAVSLLDYGAEDARETGRLRARLEAVGQPIGLIDSMIAAMAIVRGLTVVTRNTREFGRISGLQLVDWTGAA